MKNIKTTATTENERTVTGMDKYIDREALVEWLKRIPLKDLSDGRGLCRVIFEEDFKRAIKKIPKGIIVDVAPVRHGRWIDKGEYAVCTECGGQSGTQYDGVEPIPLMTQFCPNCGAKMDGGAD